MAIRVPPVVNASVGGTRALMDAGSGVAPLDDGRCTVDGIRVPALAGSHFLAVENLFWTAKALGLHAEATLQVRGAEGVGLHAVAGITFQCVGLQVWGCTLCLAISACLSSFCHKQPSRVPRPSP